MPLGRGPMVPFPPGTEAYRILLSFSSSPVSVSLNLLKQKEPVTRGKVIIYTFLLLMLIHMYLKDSAFALELQGMEEGTRSLSDSLGL